MFCKKCKSNIPEKVINRYKKGRLPSFKKRIYKEDSSHLHNDNCKFCGEKYELDEVFQNSGFSVPVCRVCLIDKDILLKLRNLELIYENIGYFEGLQA